MTTGDSPLETWEGRSVGSWAQRLGLEHFEAHATIGSTNDRLRELVAGGLGGPACLVADEQTAGRGRVGRRWESPAGGLWSSTFLPATAGVAPTLPLVAGVAAARALEAEFGLRVGLKWPNDVLLAGGKLGGILCEAVGAGVVVGIGINIVAPEAGASGGREAGEPPGAPLPPTAIEDHVEPSDGSRGRVLLSVVRALMEGSRPGGWAAVRDEWIARDALVGRRVVCSVGVRGVARGIDESGGLVVRTADGTEIVRAGSVRPESSD